MTAVTRKLAMRPGQTSLNSDYQISSFLYSKRDPGAMLFCNQPHNMCARNRQWYRLGDICLGRAHCCLHSGGFSPLSPCTHTLPKGHIRLVGRTIYDLNLYTLHSEIKEVGTGCVILCSLPVSAHNNPPLCTRQKSLF